MLLIGLRVLKFIFRDTSPKFYINQNQNISRMINDSIFQFHVQFSLNNESFLRRKERKQRKNVKIDHVLSVNNPLQFTTSVTIHESLSRLLWLTTIYQRHMFVHHSTETLFSLKNSLLVEHSSLASHRTLYSKKVVTANLIEILCFAVQVINKILIIRWNKVRIIFVFWRFA